jgi:hypothetical protein
MSTPLIFIAACLDGAVSEIAPRHREQFMEAQRSRAMGAHMPRPFLFAALLLSAPSTAFAQGPIDTIVRGRYVCEMPGDAAGQAGIPQPNRNFTVESSSRYSAPQGAGVYLRRGDRVDLTSGPRRGESYLVIRPGFLRERMADGKPGRLRCVLQG